MTPLPSGSLAVAFGKGSLWSAVVGGSAVERIEVGTGKVIGRFRADDVSALAVAGGHVWTASRDGRFVGSRFPDRFLVHSGGRRD